METYSFEWNVESLKKDSVSILRVRKSLNVFVKTNSDSIS